MAHKYDSFEAAFQQLTLYDSWVRQLIADSIAAATAAQSYASQGKWYEGINSAALSGYKAAYALLILIDAIFTATDQSHFYESIYWAAQPPDGEAVTMAGILSAMLGAKFDELQQFIGIEDAYRCALWDAPFNAEFYAALARGFKKW